MADKPTRHRVQVRAYRLRDLRTDEINSKSQWADPQRQKCKVEETIKRYESNPEYWLAVIKALPKARRHELAVECRRALNW
jgi:hypothetical protein